jgi:hypothetical protein
VGHGLKDLELRSTSAADGRDREVRLRVEGGDVLDGTKELDLRDQGEASCQLLGRAAPRDKQAKAELPPAAESWDQFPG